MPNKMTGKTIKIFRDLEILQKQNGNKITLRTSSYFGKLTFSENYLLQKCYENSEKLSQENRKKFQTAWEDFTERSLTAHTGVSGMIPFYFHMSEDLEILQKQNGNKITLRLLSYLGKMMFFKELSSSYPLIFRWNIDYVMFHLWNIFCVRIALICRKNHFAWPFNFQTHMYSFWRFLLCMYKTRKYIICCTRPNNKHLLDFK